jgi:NAD(P)-dependent dehydrogenase (short-subunit alcohol dehydrogenase family)
MTTPQHPIGSGFGATSTTGDVIAGRDLTDRLAIVTGGYSGIGLETTRALAGAGAHVVVPARRPDHARDELTGITGVEVTDLDLGDRDRVRAQLDEVRRHLEAIDFKIDLYRERIASP